MNLFKNKLSETVTDLQAKLDEMNSTFETQKEELKTATESAASLLLQKTELAEQLEQAQAEIVTLKGEAVELVTEVIDVNEKGAALAVEILSEIGQPEPVEVIDEPVDLITQFKSLKGKEAQEFYHANKAAIHARFK